MQTLLWSERRYLGVIDVDTGKAHLDWKPKARSHVAFDWVLKSDGAIVRQESRVRADNAKARGVPLPEELATAIATATFRGVASQATERWAGAAGKQSGYEDLTCTYRGVVNEETGDVVLDLLPKDQSLVAFEWVLKSDGAIVRQESRVRADNAKIRGAPVPGELAAAVAKASLGVAASSAAERVLRAEQGGGDFLKDVSCKYSGMVETRNRFTVSLPNKPSL